MKEQKIEQNIKKVEQNIADACAKVGRNKEEVTLIAVSKTKPVSMLLEAYQAGIRDFGENKVQELTDKIEVMPKDIRWHMIGHLQRNKVKNIVGKVYLIHSVDSYRLAEEISKEAAKKQVEVNILVQVNISMEESKFGTSEEEAIKLVEEVAKLPNIHIKGLMTIPPFTEDAECNRKYFKKLRQLCVDIANKNIDNVAMSILSMGMTGDYQVAVEEGAACVRVGTGIFGERNYSKESCI